MKDFIDFLKLPPNILGALSIASGALLLLPDQLAKRPVSYTHLDVYKRQLIHRTPTLAKTVRTVSGSVLPHQTTAKVRCSTIPIQSRNYAVIPTKE